MSDDAEDGRGGDVLPGFPREGRGGIAACACRGGYGPAAGAGERLDRLHGARRVDVHRGGAIYSFGGVRFSCHTLRITIPFLACSTP